MDIFSKQIGQRPEDEQARRHLQKNWGTIQKLADTLSGGKYSESLKKKKPPKAQGLIIMDQAPRRVADAPDPYLRISANGRVVVADTNSGLQLHFLGQLKRVDGNVQFVIATAENGFLTPLDQALYNQIADLADRVVNRSYSEDELAQDLKTRLNIC